jgi:predicted nucleic acid-binding protein
LITLDTSGLFAAMVREDPHHRDAASAFANDSGSIVIPAAILCEFNYLSERELGAAAVLALLAGFETDDYELDCESSDLPRVRELFGRYSDLRLGFADVAVIACAERNGGDALTFDLRHFGVVAREGRIRLVP